MPVQKHTSASACALHSAHRGIAIPRREASPRSLALPQSRLRLLKSPVESDCSSCLMIETFLKIQLGVFALEDITVQKLARRIRELRQQRGMTLKEVAESAGFS